MTNRTLADVRNLIRRLSTETRKKSPWRHVVERLDEGHHP
jgi:hypothetical protein